MKKALITLAVLGMTTGMSFAQSNVTVYGILDTGYALERGYDWRMAENINNRLGFRGSEDLGGGLKTVYMLERRFDLFDGTLGNTNGWHNGYKGSAGSDWNGQDFIGLAKKDLGQIRFGRILGLSTQKLIPFDPFLQVGMATYIYSSQRMGLRNSNTARYDSPTWDGFSFALSYSIGADASHATQAFKDRKNEGYAVNLNYTKGPLDLNTSFDRTADSNNSYMFNVAAAYKFAGVFRVSAIYEHTSDKGFWGGNGFNLDPTTGNGGGATSMASKQDVFMIGMAWDVGQSTFKASVNYARIKPLFSSQWSGPRGFSDPVVGTTRRSDLWRLGLGYEYNLSKRTQLYALTSYTNFDNKALGQFYTAIPQDYSYGVQLGMTHKF